MTVYGNVKNKLKGELYDKRVLYEQNKVDFLTQVGSLLEDFGLINVLDDDVPFDKAMFRTSFILPDSVINILVIGCALYAAVVGGFI